MGLSISQRECSRVKPKILGQLIAVSNNGGGAGVLAMDALAKAKPDGYTLVSCPQTAVAEIPHLRKTPCEFADFTPVMQFAEPEGGLARSDAPFNSFKELIEYARKNPGKSPILLREALLPGTWL